MVENARKQNEHKQFDLQESEAYKPQVVPNAFKVINGSLKTFREVAKEMTEFTTKVEQRNELNIIAKKCVGLKNIFEGSFIKETALELAGLTGSISTWINKHIHYGIAPITDQQDNPETHTYYICIEVENFDHVPEGFECLTIPSGKYAVIHKSLSGNPRDLYGVWNDGWEKQNTGFTYEYFYESISDYSDRVNRKATDFEMDLFLPLK